MVSALAKQNQQKDAELKQLTSRLNIVEWNAKFVKGNTPFVWKISNFKQLLKESQRSDDVFFSPYFQCLSGYLVGIGVKQRTGNLIGIYLYRFKGALDYRLIFPMAYQRYSFTLYIDGVEMEKGTTSASEDNAKYAGYFTKDETGGLGNPRFISNDKLPASLTNESKVIIDFHIW